MSTTPNYKEALELVKLRMKEDSITVKEAVAEYARLTEISTSQALRDVGRELLDYSKEINTTSLTLKKLKLDDTFDSYDKLPENNSFIREQCEKIVLFAKELGYEIDILTAYGAWRAYDDEYNVTFANVQQGKHLERILLTYCNVVN